MQDMTVSTRISGHMVRVFTMAGKPVEEKCDLGCKHLVNRYYTKWLYHTDETHKYNDGYNYIIGSVYVDTQGRRYLNKAVFDGMSTYFLRECDNMVFQTRVLHPAKDMGGSLITT